MRTLRASTFALTLALIACKDDEKTEPDEDNTCDPAEPEACDDGLVCEQLGSDVHECLMPVIVSGRVFGALDGEGIEGATIVGLDANGAAETRVARSGPDGRYELPVSVKRDEDGKPLDHAITLRVAAKDRQPFPTAPRSALPIQLEEAVLDGADAGAELAGYRIENAATDVALIDLPAALRGGATVEGSVAADAPGGVLVVAVAGDAASTSAVTDRDGGFVLFNVPAGTNSIEGYKQGLAIEPKSVDVPAAGLTDVVLSSSDAELTTVSGSINIVNAPGGLTSSVILVLASTFDPQAVRGEAPAGLRAGKVSNSFEIEGVPPGRYAVLAAFENDQLVRDPDEGISGTDIVFVDVAGGGEKTVDSLKVTEALAVVSPGAEEIERVEQGPLTLRWKDDSSEEGYELRLYDALGELVHVNEAIPEGKGGADVAYPLPSDVSASLKPGMLYQFRVWSFRTDPKGNSSYISASEDLRGVFEVER